MNISEISKMVKRLIHQLAVLPVMDLDIILPILSPLKHADETLHRECRLALYFRSGSTSEIILNCLLY